MGIAAQGVSLSTKNAAITQRNQEALEQLVARLSFHISP
jgi:hypothetical protein